MERHGAAALSTTKINLMFSRAKPRITRYQWVRTRIVYFALRRAGMRSWPDLGLGPSGVGLSVNDRVEVAGLPPFNEDQGQAFGMLSVPHRTFPPYLRWVPAVHGWMLEFGVPSGTSRR